jgi:hypothetical protein
VEYSNLLGIEENMVVEQVGWMCGIPASINKRGKYMAIDHQNPKKVNNFYNIL